MGEVRLSVIIVKKKGTLREIVQRGRKISRIKMPRMVEFQCVTLGTTVLMH